MTRAVTAEPTGLTSVSAQERDDWDRNRALENLMFDLVYAGKAGWATAEFNLAKAGLIEMIQGHQPGLMREGDNGWMDLRWALTDLGRRTRKARFELVMKADPPLWAAEQDAEEEAQDYQQNFADGDPDDYWTAIHRRLSNKLDDRAERISQRTKRRPGPPELTGNLGDDDWVCNPGVRLNKRVNEADPQHELSTRKDRGRICRRALSRPLNKQQQVAASGLKYEKRTPGDRKYK